jgi:rsbT co-antagonist protein RsbR
MDHTATISAVFERDRDGLLEDWVGLQLEAAGRRRDLLTDEDLRRESGRFLDLLAAAFAAGEVNGHDGPAAERLRDLLEDLSRSRALRGFTPGETATFVFSIKQPLFARLTQAADGQELVDATWLANHVLDELGLIAIEVHQQSREELIRRQSLEMLELSTPVVQLWAGVLALPLIGTLDSARTQVVMESLLEAIERTEAQIAIIDITGVPTVDTLVAQHLLKTAAAARLMGAEVILSGIRPQIAQTVVHLGVELPDLTTKASLADAFKLALRRGGWTISRSQG